MSEPVTIGALTLAPTVMPDGLAADAARVAGRLADLVEHVISGDPTLAETVAFLRSMAATADGSATGSPGLERLVAGWSLSRAEVDLIVLAGLPDEHEGYAGVLRRLSPTGEPRASAGLAAQLFCTSADERPRFRELLEAGTAVRNGILALDGDGPFYERPLQLAERLWSALHGLDAWPDAIPALTAPTATQGLEEWLETAAALRAVAALQRDFRATILVTADSEQVAFDRAAGLVWAAGVIPAAVELPPTVAPELERLVSVHACVRGVVPLVRLGRPEPPAVAVAPAFTAHPGPVVVCARAGGTLARGSRPLLAVPVETLSGGARRRMWRAAVPALAGSAPLLAARHRIEPAAAAETAADVAAVELLERRAAELDDVTASVRMRAGLSLSTGVALVRPTARWEQLVLAPDRLTQLREALDRLLHQSRVIDDWGFLAGRPGARGVRMLFAGPPGTGKSLSAEILAGALGVDLLTVDISRVVSKWIGETEKNLAEVFEAAERAQAVLFFDEADALFGKRTEVSDAHDRYANLETAYLLARLEKFEGLAVLATNLRQNVDPAFTRRLEFVVDFDPPSAEERLALWRCHLPPGAPVEDDLDLEELAAVFPVVGGLIRNAAVAAGFLAAAEERPIARRHLISSVRREYEKSGRAFPGLPTDHTPQEEPWPSRR